MHPIFQNVVHTLKKCIKFKKTKLLNSHNNFQCSIEDDDVDITVFNLLFFSPHILLNGAIVHRMAYFLSCKLQIIPLNNHTIVSCRLSHVKIKPHHHQVSLIETGAVSHP